MGIRAQREELYTRILEIELDERKLENLASRLKNSRHQTKIYMLVRALTKEKVKLTKQLSDISIT